MNEAQINAHTLGARDLALRDIWLILKKRRAMLIALAVSMALLGLAGGLIRHKRYTATGALQIQPGSASDLKQSISSALTAGGGGSLDVVIESDSYVLESEDVLMKVAQTLKLQENREFLRGKTTIKTARFGGSTIQLLHGDLSNPYVRTYILKSLRQGLTVSRVPRTQMITVSFKSTSPKLSADVVNALEAQFIESNFRAHYNTTRQISKWLTEQLNDLRAVVQESQDKLADFQRKLGINAMDPSHSLIIGEISSLQKGVSDATEARVAADARYHILEALPPDQIQDSPTALGSDGPSGLLSTLRAQRASALAELGRLEPVFGPKYPQVEQLNSQVKTLDGEIRAQEIRIVQQAKDGLQVTRAAEAQARSLLEAKLREEYGQQSDLAEYMLLAQDYESNRRVFESMVARLREASVDAGLDAADVRVVDLASLPIEPSSMSAIQLALIGLFFGVFFGFTAAFVLDRLDVRLRDTAHIESLLDLPVLAIVPQSQWKNKGQRPGWTTAIELLRSERSPFAESIRTLRTSLLLASVSKGPRSIAVTSSQPGEGKSTVSLNLAAALAQAGKRVILVDTDMRRPSIYGKLGLKGSGLSEILTANSSLEDAIQSDEALPGLHIIGAGTTPPLPADLLGSEQFSLLIAQLKERYDFIVFDCPPALSVTDPAIVASMTDGVVFVVRQGVCTGRMLQRAVSILRSVHAKMYGFILNGVDSSLPEYYGYAGYYSYESES